MPGATGRTGERRLRSGWRRSPETASIIANASTGLYMWMLQSDVLGLCLNLGNAAMCGATVAITVFKRKQGGLGPSASS